MKHLTEKEWQDNISRLANLILYETACRIQREKKEFIDFCVGVSNSTEQGERK